jgi:hypothetical protein
MKLKSKTIISIIILAFTFSNITDAFAQDTRDVTAKVKRGIKLSGGLAYITADNDPPLTIVEESYVGNLEFGFLYEAMITGNFGLRPELLYSLKGGSITIDELGANEVTSDIMLHYIEVPFLATLRILPHFTLHFGPYVGFMIAGDADVDNPAQGQIVQDLDKDAFDPLDGGVVGGLEVDYSDMIFGARFYGGFQRLGEKANYLANSRNYTFNVYVGYVW